MTIVLHFPRWVFWAVAVAGYGVGFALVFIGALLVRANRGLPSNPNPKRKG